MKLWKIGLYILCILILVYWYVCIRNEGFQDVPVAPVTTLNVPYTSKYNEAYLVAPNIPDLKSFVPIYDDTLNPDGSLANNKYAFQQFNIEQDYYKNAYSFSEAQGVCESLGATLATPEQMNIAAELGGFWSIASWASDNKMYVILPNLVKNTVPNTLAAIQASRSGSGSGSGSGSSPPWNPLQVLNTPAITKAFPVCWGVKPPEPTSTIQSFNQTDYSMFTNYLLSSVMNPTANDLLQVQFTQDQAVYALQQRNYNIADGGANPARQFLIGKTPSTGFGNVNTEIYKEAVGSDAYNSDGSNLNALPCDILTTTFTDFQTKFDKLREVMNDVNEGVFAMEYAKDENASFQRSLESICYIESPTTSPACSKIATLDFELIYGTTGSDLSTSRLAALELLNVTLFQRQQELCMALTNLFQVQSILGCPSSLGPSPDCIYEQIGSGSDSGSAWTIRDLKSNSEPFLKLKLQEISPYFSIATYKTLATAIDQLSVIINIPSLNDFNTSTQNFNAVNSNMKAIKGYMNYQN